MKELDGLMEKLESLYFPIYVKGKEYPGNNPYILNKINNMLKAGRIKKRYGGLTEPIEPIEPDDLTWEDNRLHFSEGKEYLFYDELEQITIDICDEINRLKYENNERLVAEELRENTQDLRKNT